MTIPFDLSPTARLSGLHMVGTVVRRFLISYPVPPATLEKYVPPGAELSLHDGMAWVSACFVRIDDMRPNIVPRIFGMGFNYLIHRTRARLPFPDGRLREAVLVLEPNINRPLLSTFGGMLTSVKFRTRQIEFTQDDARWRIEMTSQDETLYGATIEKSSCHEAMPPKSRFATIAGADDFLLGVAFGGQFRAGHDELGLLPETHEPWTTLACDCQTHKNAFLESLGIAAVEADHVITMADVPHYFGITPIKTKLIDQKQAEA